jgi:hypothetical protein
MFAIAEASLEVLKRIPAREQTCDRSAEALSRLPPVVDYVDIFILSKASCCSIRFSCVHNYVCYVMGRNWDDAKNEYNKSAHRISFETALRVFDDRLH